MLLVSMKIWSNIYLKNVLGRKILVGGYCYDKKIRYECRGN